MTPISRRKFIYTTALISGIPGVLSSFDTGTYVKSGGILNDIQVGVIASADNPEKDLNIVRDLGFPGTP